MPLKVSPQKVVDDAKASNHQLFADKVIGSHELQQASLRSQEFAGAALTSGVKIVRSTVSTQTIRVTTLQLPARIKNSLTTGVRRLWVGRFEATDRDGSTPSR